MTLCFWECTNYILYVIYCAHSHIFLLYMAVMKTNDCILASMLCFFWRLMFIY